MMERTHVLSTVALYSYLNFRALIKTRNIEGEFPLFVQGIDTVLWNVVDKEASRIEPEIQH